MNYTHLDLYAGIRGFSIAFEAEGFTTIGASEIDEDKNIVGSHWFPEVPNVGNIRDADFSARVLATIGRPHVLTGGVPCQPASALGQMRGTADERWLWPETIGVVRDLRPLFGVFENPPSLLVLESGRAWNGIVSGLAALGYDLWWDVLPAAAFGAGHLRERVILVIADGDIKRRAETGGRLLEGFANGVWSLESRGQSTEENLQAPADTSVGRREARAGLCAGEPRGVGRGRPGDDAGETVTHSDDPRLQGHSGDGAVGEEQGRDAAQPRRPASPPDLRGRVDREDWWHEAHTGIPVLASGLSSRLVEASCRCVGDSVVPQVIQPIARAIKATLDTLNATA